MMKNAEIEANATAATQRGVARRCEYSIEIVESVCVRLSEGEMVKAALESLGIARRTFFGWIRQHPEAAAQYRAARLARGEHCRDQLIELNEKLKQGKIDPQSARVLSDNLRWMAAKDAPELFSDRVELTGANGQDLTTEDKPRDNLELARWMALVLTKAGREVENQEEQEAPASAQRAQLRSLKPRGS